MSEAICQFCGAPSICTWEGKGTLFKCKTRPNDLKPGSRACWEGFVMKLQDRIVALEALVNKPRPRTVREVAIACGWHPEIKVSRAPSNEG